MKAEFEWSISDPDEHSLVMVRCRLVGSDKAQTWGPMPQRIARSFLTAKREVLDRTVRSRTDAIRLFTPQPGGLLQ